MIEKYNERQKVSKDYYV